MATRPNDIRPSGHARHLFNGELKGEFMNGNKVEKNVMTFLDKASDDYGKIQSNFFSQEMYCNLVEQDMSSPIEQMFWIACHVLCKANLTEVNPDIEFNKKGEPERGYGIFITQQAKVGRYKVDFLFVCNDYFLPENNIPLIVELDGHDFHDKDKKQRAYEKSRDRFLVKSGYKVLHFTGSEVVADPYRVAYEVLEHMALFIGSGTDEYDSANPFGIE